MPIKDPVRRKAAKRTYYLANKSAIQARQRRWKHRNPDKVKSAGQRYYRRHKLQIDARNMRNYRTVMQDPKQRNEARKRSREAMRAHKQLWNTWKKQWRDANKHRANDISKRYRARRLGAKGTHSFTQWMARVALYGWRCAYCWTPLTLKTLTKDHIIPLSKGGTDWAANLAPACKSCNAAKGNRR